MKIVWGVDPLEKKVPLRKAAKILTGLTQKPPIIEAVYVAGRKQRIQILTNPPYAKSLLDKAVGGFPHVQRTSVVWDFTGSQAKEVDELLEFAIKQDADLVAVFSHSPNAIERLFVGSFAEAVATHSPIPTLLIKPSNKSTKGVKRLLFATDLSVSSLKAFRELLRLASAGKWSIVVFHAVDPFQNEGAKESQPYYSKVKRSLQTLSSIAADSNIDTTVVTDNRHIPVPALVLEAADLHQCDLISTGAPRKASQRLLLGSITKQILRVSPLPVLVMKP